MGWRSIAIVGCATSLLAAPQQPSPSATPVASATVRVVRKAGDVQFIYLENLRDLPLIEWKVALRSGDDRGGMTVSRRYDPKSTRPDDTPIAPGETKRQRVQWQGERLTETPSVALAVFADGSHVGTAPGVAAYHKQQEALAADLTYWQSALQNVPRTSPRAAETYLRGKIRERLQADPSDPSQLSGAIGGWLGPMRAADWAYRMTDSTLKEIVTRLENATRYRAHLAARQAVEQSVAVRTLIGLGSEFVAVVENLRDTPLEAWDLEIYDPPTSRFAHQRQGFDAGQVIEDGRPGGRLRRNEVREIGIRPADDLPDSAAPRVGLSFALWSDLTWEGSAAMRDERFKSRERQAAQHEFWIAALSDAALRPAREALSFLREKRAERRRQAPQEFDPLQGNFEMWEASVTREPEMFSSRLITYRDRLQEEHRLLTRHLNR
ncbi:MAG TPA: hypothetical protein VES67_04570 [Vicinamibacterales bacterium]|nr:hypothetical protein [Vicinamibacterales bacterium]